MNQNNLISKLQNGDEKAFEEFVNLYSDPLFSYALSLSVDHHTANDIVQEVFINVFEYRKKLNPKYSIESFLYKSTYNKFIDTYYKNKSRSKLHEQYINLLNQLIVDYKYNAINYIIKL